MQPIQYQQPAASVTQEFSKGTIIALGVLHIVCSVIIFILGCIPTAIFYDTKGNINENGAGIITAPFFFVTGILSLCMRCRSQNRSLVTSHNVFAILSMIMSIALIATSSIGVYRYRSCNRSWIRLTCEFSIDRISGEPIYASLLALALIELIITILSVAYGFRIFNCCCAGNQPVNVQQSYQMQPNNYTQANPSVNQIQQMNQPIVQCFPTGKVFPQQPVVNVQSSELKMQQQPQIITSSSGQQFVLYPVASSSTSLAPTSKAVTAAITPSMQ